MLCDTAVKHGCASSFHGCHDSIISTRKPLGLSAGACWVHRTSQGVPVKACRIRLAKRSEARAQTADRGLG